MITRVVFAPQPLFLLPEYQGRTMPAPELRTAAVEAVSRLGDAGRIVVISGGEAGPRLPVGLRVAYELLAAAGVGHLPGDVLVPFDLPTDACLERGQQLATDDISTALLVMADGSARRGEKAPGYVDDRARPYDDAFVRAIERGAPDELAALDADLATELLFQGRAALQVAAGAVGVLTPSPMMLWTGDPFGVMYVVAEWALE